MLTCIDVFNKKVLEEGFNRWLIKWPKRCMSKEKDVENMLKEK